MNRSVSTPPGAGHRVQLNPPELNPRGPRPPPWRGPPLTPAPRPAAGRAGRSLLLRRVSGGPRHFCPAKLHDQAHLPVRLVRPTDRPGPGVARFVGAPTPEVGTGSCPHALGRPQIAGPLDLSRASGRRGLWPAPTDRPMRRLSRAGSTGRARGSHGRTAADHDRRRPDARRPAAGSRGRRRRGGARCRPRGPDGMAFCSSSSCSTSICFRPRSRAALAPRVTESSRSGDPNRMPPCSGGASGSASTRTVTVGEDDEALIASAGRHAGRRDRATVTPSRWSAACGGAGASVFAAALAATAERAGRGVVLADCDPWGPGLDVMLGIEDRGGIRWDELAAPVRAAATRCPAPGAAGRPVRPRAAPRCCARAATAVGRSRLPWSTSSSRPAGEPVT